jgi:hypothetical protein
MHGQLQLPHQHQHSAALQEVLSHLNSHAAVPAQLCMQVRTSTSVASLLSCQVLRVVMDLMHPQPCPYMTCWQDQHQVNSDLHAQLGHL